VRVGNLPRILVNQVPDNPLMGDDQVELIVSIRTIVEDPDVVLEIRLGHPVDKVPGGDPALSAFSGVEFLDMSISLPCFGDDSYDVVATRASISSSDIPSFLALAIAALRLSIFACTSSSPLVDGVKRMGP
jgi:hypothetical protein